MAHATEKVGFPDIELLPGMTIVLEAVDPSVDAAVSGVAATRWSIYGDELGALGDSVIEDAIPTYVPEDEEVL